MARIAAEAKMGYYPTPILSLRYIADRIGVAALSKVHCLDPCCGEGSAIRYVKEVSAGGRAVVWGVELDADRAAKAVVTGLNVEQGSIYEARINPLESMGLLYLNPPYSTDDGERLEMQFLRYSVKWLAPSGVMVFIVPEHIFEKRSNRDWIGQHFMGIRVYRLNSADYPVFRQVVLFAIKRVKRVEDGEVINPPPYSYIEESPMETYLIPETAGPSVFQVGDSVSDKEIDEHASFTREKLEGIYKFSHEVKKISPLLPLKNGHLIALLSSGVLNGEVKRNSEHIVLKGFSDRIETQIETEKEVITKNTYSVKIRIIDVIKGEWHDIK